MNEIGSFVETWMDLEIVKQSEVRKRKTNIVYLCIYVESRKMVRLNWFARPKQRHRYREQTYVHQGGKAGWGGGGGGMNWEIWIDIYTLICIKQITNKSLLYKKINKIQKRNKNQK